MILQTASGQKTQVFTTRYGDTLVVDVINTKLALPQGNSFSQVNPVKGIASVTVTQLSVNSIHSRGNLGQSPNRNSQGMKPYQGLRVN